MSLNLNLVCGRGGLSIGVAKLCFVFGVLGLATCRLYVLLRFVIACLSIVIGWFVLGYWG